MKLARNVLLATLVIFLTWAFASTHSSEIASPPAVFARVGTLLVSGELALHTWSTLRLAMSGYLIACVIAVIIAIATSLTPAIRDLVVLTLDFLRSLPAAALIPPLLTIARGTTARVSVIAIGCTAVLGLATAARPLSHRDRNDVVRTLKLSRWTQLFLVDLPQSIAELALASRVAISLALVLAVVIEMLLGASYGLGDRLTMFAQNDRPGMYAILLILGAIGLVLNRVVGLAERLVVRRLQ